MHKELIQQSLKEIALADHLIYVTYPLIREVKFLAAIAEHVTKAAELALKSLLTYEREYKRIEPFADNFAVMIDVFSPDVQRRYNFGPEYMHLLKRLVELKQYNQESTLRFRRKDKYILTTQNYDIHILDLDKVKRFCQATKNFVNKVDELWE